MRRATPPWVRKVPAKMKNGIAMMANWSSPVNRRCDTNSIGMLVMKNRNASTVRPSAIEIGMPVSMSTISNGKMIQPFIRSAGLPPRRGYA